MMELIRTFNLLHYQLIIILKYNPTPLPPADHFTLSSIPPLMLLLIKTS